VYDASEIPIRFSQEEEANGRGKTASRTGADRIKRKAGLGNDSDYIGIITNIITLLITEVLY
jgi:hypothetical protein